VCVHVFVFDKTHQFFIYDIQTGLQQCLYIWRSKRTAALGDMLPFLLKGLEVTSRKAWRQGFGGIGV